MCVYAYQKCLYVYAYQKKPCIHVHVPVKTSTCSSPSCRTGDRSPIPLSSRVVPARGPNLSDTHICIHIYVYRYIHTHVYVYIYNKYGLSHCHRV